MYDIRNPTENDITNNLILKYDESFNELYDKITNLNNSIITKESYIKKIINEIYNKEINILILYYSVFIVILILILIVMNGYKFVSVPVSFGILAIFIIIVLLYVYLKIQNLNSSYYFNQKLKNISVKMDDYSTDRKNKKDKQCPSTCTLKTKKRNMADYLIDDEEMIYSNDLPYHYTPTLNIDDQTNVWQYGEGIKDKKYNSDILYGTDDNIKYFSKGINGLTYYECNWMGDNSNPLPNKEGRYSSIPCSYRENSKEINRYICKDTIDPNIDGINKCDQI